MPSISKTNAESLFDTLQHYANLSTTTVCRQHFAEPHTPCPQSKYFCGTESKQRAINFDAVKVTYCKRNSIHDPMASVDAVLYKGNTFLLVEIKGWQNFDRRQIKKNDSTDQIKDKADKQAEKYKLKSKIEDSIEICRKLSEDTQVFDKMDVVYILLTDVPTITDPLRRIKVNLNVLSYKTENINMYISAALSEIQRTNLPIRYKHCQEFDDFYNSL